MADDAPPDGPAQAAATNRIESSAMEPAAITSARHLVTHQLATWGCRNPDVALVFSELVTNAVVHAGGAVRITVTRDDHHIRIDVHDHGPGQPHVRLASSRSGGLGLHIVDQLSDQWGSHPTRTGKLVWAIVACHNDEPDVDGRPD